MTALEDRMDEQERLRASQDQDLSDIGEKLRVQGELMKALAITQSEHTATLSKHTAILDRHTAMHREHATALAMLQLDMGTVKDGMRQIVGMLDRLIEQDGQQ
ncbi:hypothetical protein [Actinoplanes sp. NPDC049802]|uniref:hypothetical protein n=1 Tax=Actinoplanes sp. NPDC049802 TaxID=3154742 RepID=UPI0033FF6DE4